MHRRARWRIGITNLFPLVAVRRLRPILMCGIDVIRYERQVMARRVILKGQRC